MGKFDYWIHNTTTDDIRSTDPTSFPSVLGLGKPKNNPASLDLERELPRVMLSLGASKLAHNQESPSPKSCTRVLFGWCVRILIVYCLCYVAWEVALHLCPPQPTEPLDHQDRCINTTTTTTTTPANLITSTSPGAPNQTITNTIETRNAFVKPLLHLITSTRPETRGITKTKKMSSVDNHDSNSQFWHELQTNLKLVDLTLTDSAKYCVPELLRSSTNCTLDWTTIGAHLGPLSNVTVMNVTSDQRGQCVTVGPEIICFEDTAVVLHKMFLIEGTLDVEAVLEQRIDYKVVLALDPTHYLLLQSFDDPAKWCLLSLYDHECVSFTELLQHRKRP